MGVIQEVEVERIEWATTILFRGMSVPVVGSGAWRRELKAAFRRRVMETHPDRARVLGRPEVQLRREFHAVTEAYRLLGSLTEPVRSTPSRPTQPTTRPPRRPTDSGRGQASRPPPPPPRRSPPPPPEPEEHFHRGPMPQGSLRFAEFLYYSGRISWRTLVESITWQRQQRPSVGRIAVGWGHLTEDEVRDLLESRRREKSFGIPFGEHALRRGLLTPFQLLAILGRQRRLQRRIGEFFVERGIIDSEEIYSIRQEVIRHNSRCQGSRGNAGSA